MSAKKEHSGSDDGRIDENSYIEEAKKHGKDICRDYLNNICNRGSRCKFYHPPESVDKVQSAADEPYNFCLDFQNQGCHRDNCRYVHAHREDVERYKSSSEVTLGLARALAALTRNESINGIPICKQFQTGQCSRGRDCRYWHINVDEERRKRFAGRSCGGGPNSVNGGRDDPWRRDMASYYYDDDDYGPPSKRGAYPGPPMRTPMPAPMSQPVPSRALIELERRNAELMAEVEALRRENRRERERYEDLLALIRQQSGKSAVSSLASAGLSGGMSQVSGLGAGSIGGQTGQSGLQQTGYSWTNDTSTPKYSWNA